MEYGNRSSVWCSGAYGVCYFSHELLSLLPKDDVENQWAVIIRRLELVSLAFYLLLVFTCFFMFFFHGWYNY